MKSAKGLALAGTLAVVLSPAVSDAHPRFQPDIAAVTFQSKKLERIQEQGELLFDALVATYTRNSRLINALESFDRLHDELSHFIVDDREDVEVSPREQLAILSSVMLNWLDDMVQELDPKPEIAAVNVSASRSLGSQAAITPSELDRFITELEDQAKGISESIAQIGEENAKLEGILKGIVTQLDIVIGVHADPAADVMDAYNAFSRYSELLQEYADQTALTEVSAVAEEDEERLLAGGPR